jgi:hypothetical protein
LSFEWDEDRNKLSKILQKFDEYTIEEVNETYERNVFNSRNQDTSLMRRVYGVTRKLIQTCMQLL